MTIPKDNLLEKKENSECCCEYFGTENEEEETLDPFVVMHEELRDLVLQHFDMDASEVCTSWYDLTCFSKYVLKNVVIKFGARFNKLSAEKQNEVLEMIKNTERKYCNIYIDNTENDATKKSIELLKFFEKNWLSLKISWMKISDFYQVPDISLSNLEELKLEIVPEEVYVKLMKDTTKLKKALFQVGCSNDSVREEVIDCLKRNVHLKNLKLLAQIFACVFSQDVSEIFKFKLEKFIVSNAEKILKSTEQNFIRFLLTQAACLEYISIGDLRVDVLKVLYSEMRVLKTIYLGNLTNIAELSLIENLSITIIKLPYLDDFEALKKILLATPNCEQFYCKTITRELLDFVMITMKQLTKFSSKNSIDPELIEYYQSTTDTNINKNIEIFITEFW